MSASTAPTRATPTAAAPLAEPAISPAEIDASCRWPVLLLFLSATGWLLLGTLLSLISSIKLHGPGFLTDGAWLTLGRVRPAGVNALLYGCASQAGLAVLLWLLCRLGRVRLYFQVPVMVAWFFWNVGVTVGVLGILAGDSTGFEWLEMPRYASPILFIAYAVIGLCAVVTFHFRAERSLYVSQWFLLGALFWFPWIYSAANLLLVFEPVRGTMQSVVNAWYVSNFLNLWLGPIALAGIYYFIPKLVGRPLYSRSLAAMAFWTMAFAAGWTGLTSLIGGPVPRWMPAASTAASVLLLVPLVANAVNWHLTRCQNCAAVKGNTILHFIIAGEACYLLLTLLSVVVALPEVAAQTQFTYIRLGLHYLAFFGFISMTLFGCAYYIVPRVAQVEWPKPHLLRAHWLLSVIGVVLVTGALLMGGWVQGQKLHDSAILAVLVTKGTTMWIALSTLGILLLLVGQIAFLMNLAAMLRELCVRNCAWICDLCCPPDAPNPGRKS